MTKSQLFAPLLLIACTNSPAMLDATDGSLAPHDATSPTLDSSPDSRGAYPKSPDILLHYSDAVPVGVEDVKCIDVPGPVQDTYVTGWHVERHSGAHHAGVAIRRAGKPYVAPTRCSVDPAIDEGLLISTQPVLDFTLPGGAAILVPAGSSFIVETHEINSAPSPVEASVDFALHTTTEPKQIANLFVLVASGSNIPPAMTKTMTVACGVSRDMGILAITSHSHAHNVLVTGTIGTTERYRSTTWAEPETATFDPPLAVPMGTSISWACTVNNTTANTLTQCQNRDTCEMCELIGWAVMPQTWSCYK